MCQTVYEIIATSKFQSLFLFGTIDKVPTSRSCKEQKRPTNHISNIKSMLKLTLFLICRVENKLKSLI